MARNQDAGLATAASAKSLAGGRGGRGQPVADEAIFTRVHGAIVERRLEPGTKLGEEALCEAFGVSRAQIRRVLLNLAHAKLVELRPNRGAYVAQPSVREARHVFEARRAVEAAVVERAVDRMTEEMFEALVAIIREEHHAQERGDKQAAIRLSGDFHLRLAEIAGNEVLSSFLQELVSRTSLIIATYGMASDSECSHDDHRTVARALQDGDAAAAITHMKQHLRFIEEHLNFAAEVEPQVDLKTILGGVVK
jgi:DNA-binding GntR family transcriptional regulator